MYETYQGIKTMRYTHKGKKVVLSATEVVLHKADSVIRKYYETMLMFPNGREIDTIVSHNAEDAIKAMDTLFGRYSADVGKKVTCQDF